MYRCERPKGLCVVFKPHLCVLRWDAKPETK